VLIDPEPTDIIRQLDEGILLAPPDAEQARQTALRLDVLNQLRAATHALLEIRRPLSDSAERPRWLVGIGFNPSAMYLLQRAADLAYGMGAFLRFQRIILPQAARFAIPGLGNVWQLVLKESALISVVGLVELMRQAQIGAGSTRKPFTFFLTAGVLYLLISLVSGAVFRRAEARAMRGIRRAS